ncbi:MAG: hypothetical protein J7J65_07060 [Candidatus Korarchaeota archaeon]|nr:hypothetical protein [Candidatus Korarchaeota archaeon]
MPEEKSKIPTSAYLMWIVALVATLLVSLLLIYMGVDSLTKEDLANGAFNMLMGVAGIGIAIKLAYDLSKMKLAYEEEKQEFLAELKCTDCGRKMLRPFKEGDYVGKISDEDRCPQCSSSMVLTAIFARTPSKRKEGGIGVLPVSR